MDARQKSLIARYGAAYIRSLVAAEAAVRRGEFNAAKVLRVAEYVQRTLAMRLLSGKDDIPNLTTPGPPWMMHEGNLHDATTSLLYLGVWLANHDIGHTAQIRRLCSR